ncbi:hypothetical protein EYF80_035522 [Liparis tanakae]|uniref:Uncharacterized protein n=1 Tax=Liparis tanakae TaxID=230148 RepID=A0A4Z2GNG3_9TELE|nr:hypothetical protein EYF80_035522 [Liparis tanakae]
MPFSRDWQSGGMKWGMWNTPLFTFSRSWRAMTRRRSLAAASPHSSEASFSFGGGTNGRLALAPPVKKTDTSGSFRASPNGEMDRTAAACSQDLETGGRKRNRPSNRLHDSDANLQKGDC